MRIGLSTRLPSSKQNVYLNQESIVSISVRKITNPVTECPVKIEIHNKTTPPLPFYYISRSKCIMSSSQLSNPKAVWFLGAPVSKAIVITAVVTYIVAEMNKLHQALIFGASTRHLCTLR